MSKCSCTLRGGVPEHHAEDALQSTVVAATAAAIADSIPCAAKDFAAACVDLPVHTCHLFNNASSHTATQHLNLQPATQHL